MRSMHRPLPQQGHGAQQAAHAVRVQHRSHAAGLGMLGAVHTASQRLPTEVLPTQVLTELPRQVSLPQSTETECQNTKHSLCFRTCKLQT